MPFDATADAAATAPRRWLAPAVLVIGIALTAAISAWSWHRESREHTARFERRAERVVQALANRVQSYVDTLPGLRALAAAGGPIDDAAFERYVEAISLQRRYPGLALSFVAERVDGRDRGRYVAAVRGDNSRRPDGHPHFEIRPPGARPEHMVIRHVHPFDANTFGYDLFDPDRSYRVEVDAALRSGGYVATGPLLLARDRDNPMAPALSSVVIRAATYRTPQPPADEGERLAAATGAVGIAFRTAELLRSVIPPEQLNWLHLRITDVQAEQDGRHALVFDSSWLVPGASRAADGPVQLHPLAVADRQWRLEIGLQPQAATPPLDSASVLVALLGLLLSGALAAMTHTLVRANANAARQVREATEQLRGEKKSAELSELRFRMLFENTLEAALRMRPDGSILAANPAACALFGASEAELTRRGRDGMVDPDDPRLAQLLAELGRTDRARGQLRLQRADGSRFEAEMSISQYIDADGQATNSLIVRDVTERERALAQQAELSAILDASPDFVGSADVEGRLTYLNRAARRMLGLAPDTDLRGLSFARCHPPWATSAVLDVGVPHALRHGVWAGQLAIACADGRELPVSQVIICQRDAQGRATRLSTVARDLSEVHAAQAQQRALETRLQEAQKMESIGTLAGGVAHDFNNVLAVILGNLAIAREDLGAGHPVQQPLALVQQAATRARTLVQQILAFSRRLPQERTVQPLAPLLDEPLALLRSTLPASARLEREVADEPLYVEVDAHQVQQVLLNLCTNSLQALPAHSGQIRVEVARAEAGMARLSVIDDGSGMDAATRARIFEPFFTTKPVGQGTGLGLAVVHGIVTASGGRIVVDSAPGRGTRIDVLLPLRDPPAVPEAPPEAVLAGAAAPAPGAHGNGGGNGNGGGGGESILLADDDEVVGLTTEVLLQRAGYRVTRVGSGLAAVETVRDDPLGHALLITDYNMPGLSGLAVAESVAALAPGLPVLITSGYVTEELLDQARALGVRGVLLKEHSLEHLATLVRQTLAGQAA